MTLFANREAQVEFQNYQRPTLKITKVDINGKHLTGAIFEVKTKAGVKIGDFPVDANGEITVPQKHLTEGYYLITEIQSPKGYILDKTPHEVYLRPGKTTEVSIENEKKPGLTIYKVDSVVGDGVKGAKFELWVSKDKTEHGTYQKLNDTYYYTDENGMIELPELDTGWYKVKEVEPPAGYMLKEPSEQILYIEHDKGSSITFENTPKSALVIRKIDSDTGAPLANAWFRVRYLGGTSGSGGTIIGEYQTSANGNIVITGLDAGTYICEEISAPHGYVMDTAPQTAYISGKEQDCITLTFTNSKYGSLLIKKVDSVTKEPLSDVQFFISTSDGAVVGNSNGYFTTDSAGAILVSDIKPGTTLVVKETRTIPGYILDDTPQTVKIVSNETMTLEFRNQPTGSLLVRKVCATNPSITLQNAEFKIAYADGSLVGDSNGIFRTNESGEIRVEGLTPGKSVVVTETRAPAGFLIDTAPQTAVIQSGKMATLTFKDQPKGKLIVQKRDSQTGAVLPGAEFRITTAAGCEVGLDGVIGSSTLTSNGIFTTDGQGEIRITNLAPGAYVLSEIKAPDGYVMDVSAKSQTVIVNPNDTQTLRFYNDPLCSLTLTKRDSVTGKPVPGTEFTVKDGNGNILGRYTTGKDGTVTVTGLIPGSTVVVTETKVPSGYVLNSTPQTITIKKGTGNAVTSGGTGSTDGNSGGDLVFEDDPKTKLIIEKYITGTTTPLKGVTFLVTDSSGELLGNENGEFTTDENGRIVIEGLEPGVTVIAKEIRTLEGYILDSTPKSIKIKVGAAQTLKFYNQKKGCIVIRKLDSVTKKPLAGVEFQLTYADGSYVDADNGHLSSRGLYTTNKNGEIRVCGVTGTIVVTETKTIDGYTIDEATRTQSVKVHASDTQYLTFYNDPIGGLELIKVSEADKNVRIPDTTFEIRRASDGGLVKTVTTGKNGRVYVDLDAGSYYATEIEAAKGYKLDSTQHPFTVQNGRTSTLTVANAPFSGIIIHKVDSITGAGIYDVKFLVYDQNKKPIGEYSTDNSGYIYIDDLTVQGKGKLFIRELEAAPGYELDKEYKTVYVQPGKTIEIEWKNTPITGQIQVLKYAAEASSVTGTASGAPLQGAVYEISEARSGKAVDYITTDARGVAASKPLPLGRYKIREVTAPAYWLLSSTVFDETLEYSGQIIKISDYDKPVKLGVTITKRGNAQVLAGSQMRYDFTVANTSNVPLEKFYWHERIPTDATRATVFTTGTYSAQLTYRVLYKTNYRSDYQLLASNLSTSSNYSFALNAIPTQTGEYVTDVFLEFGKVPVGFQSTGKPTLTVQVLGTVPNGYQIVNRADVGGCYLKQWVTAQATWLTIVRKLPDPTLPKTGY